jgi:recombination protein RecT
MTTTTLQKTTRPQTVAAVPKTVKSWLGSDYFRQQVALVLPKHMTADRFVRVALSALGRVPKLAHCTPESVLKCMMTCSELGLEPDGRRAHLIPYKDQCTLIVDYKGLVELAMRSGTVSSIFAQIVCERDEFTYLTGEISHRIDFRQARGPMYAVYCIVKFKDGGMHTEVMTKDDVDRIRGRSRAGGAGPWMTDYEEMAKKTVFRRASKWITLSPEVQDALEREDAPVASSLVGEVSSNVLTPLPEPEAEAGPEASEPAPIDVPSDPPPQAVAAAIANSQAPIAKPEGELHTVQQTLEELVTGAGYTFNQFQKWAVESGNVPEADSLALFEEVPTNHCKRLLRAQVGLLKGLQMVKEQEGGAA